MDCIVNKTAISARTNRIIGGAAPARYLAALERRGEMTPAALDQILTTHLITPATLRTDDFDAFFEARRQALVNLIHTAMGKSAISTEEPVEPAGEPIDSEDDTDDDVETLEAA